MRWVERFLTYLPIILLLLTSRGSLNITPLRTAAAPYHYPLISWEVSHVPGKWFYKIRDLLPGGHRQRERRRQEVKEFIALGEKVNRTEGELRRAIASSASPDEVSRLENELQRLRDELARRGAQVEEILESEISDTLGREGFKSRLGIVFPPVDFAFAQPPKVLITSPRDRIEMLETVLLQPQTGLARVEALEERVTERWDLSALVEDAGGLSTYPSVMNSTYGLRGTLSVACHEWLHHYLYFRPLGRNYFSSPEMATLNETVANLAGAELGDLTYEAITGEKVVRHEPPQEGGEPPAFDFNREMRKTRLRVDELLALGHVEEAEAYMEERRLLFVEQGYYIRKINQAYFAFHGTYADAPASVSPMHGELKRLRASTSSVGEFVRTVARFGNYADFKAYVDALPPLPGG